MSTRIRIQANPKPEGGVAVFIYDQDKKGDPLRAAKPITFCKQELLAGGILDMTAHISNEDAQTLFTELWDAGFRPQNTAADDMTSGVERAKNDHIRDLRELLHKCIPAISKG